MEQLYARVCYQNVTEHKPQATVYETKKIYRHRPMHNIETGSRLPRPAGMSCPVCMVAACTWDVSILRWHSYRLLWHAIALIDVTIGEIGAFDEVHEWSLSLLLPSMRQMVCVFSLSSLWLWHQTQEFTERYFT